MNLLELDRRLEGRASSACYPRNENGIDELAGRLALTRECLPTGPSGLVLKGQFKSLTELVDDRLVAHGTEEKGVSALACQCIELPSRFAHTMKRERISRLWGGDTYSSVAFEVHPARGGSITLSLFAHHYTTTPQKNLRNPQRFPSPERVGVAGRESVRSVFGECGCGFNIDIYLGRKNRSLSIIMRRSI